MLALLLGEVQAAWSLTRGEIDAPNAASDADFVGLVDVDSQRVVGDPALLKGLGGGFLYRGRVLDAVKGNAAETVEFFTRDKLDLQRWKQFVVVASRFLCDAAQEKKGECRSGLTTSHQQLNTVSPVEVIDLGGGRDRWVAISAGDPWVVPKDDGQIRRSSQTNAYYIRWTYLKDQLAGRP